LRTISRVQGKKSSVGGGGTLGRARTQNYANLKKGARKQKGDQPKVHSSSAGTRPRGQRQTGGHTRKKNWAQRSNLKKTSTKVGVKMATGATGRNAFKLSITGRTRAGEVRIWNEKGKETGRMVLFSSRTRGRKPWAAPTIRKRGLGKRREQHRIEIYPSGAAGRLRGGENFESDGDRSDNRRVAAGSEYINPGSEKSGVGSENGWRSSRGTTRQKDRKTMTTGQCEN